MKNHEQSYVKPPQAAEHLGVSERTILNWVAGGHLQGLRIGPRALVRIPTSELERLLPTETALK